MATVLIVDDDTITQYVMSVVLESRGHALLHASTPEQALAVSKEHRIDLVITDVHMPGMDGFELARRLQERNPRTHIMYVSGHPYPECTLVKPYSAESLVAAVDAIFNRNNTA